MSGRIAEWRARDCEVLGVSTDDLATHTRWLTTPPGEGGLGPLDFRLAADPDGAVARRFGIYVPRQNLAQRAVFLVDPNGVIQYQVVHHLSVGRNTDELLRVLDGLQSGGLCPGEREMGGPTIDVAANLQPGRVLGPYRIEAELGRGTFGVVVRARDTLLDRPVALKILTAESNGSLEPLLNEARAAAALNHPNVCTIHAVDTSNGAAMIVMELVEGRTVAELLEDGPLTPEQSTRLARQAASGMAAAHEAGVIHGDLKPGNLLVADGERIKIMDFGLARRMPAADDETLPHTPGADSGLSGTLAYMAPEQANGEPATPASDTFALGLVLCEMLTGSRVISGANAVSVIRQLDNFDPTPHVARVPRELQAALRAALDPDPLARPSMSELGAQLA